MGPEYDDDLRRAVRETLYEMGAKQESEMPWIPDLEKIDFDVNGMKVTVTAETYLGLSLAGPAELVDEIAAKVKGKQRQMGLE